MKLCTLLLTLGLLLIVAARIEAQQKIQDLLEPPVIAEIKMFGGSVNPDAPGKVAVETVSLPRASDADLKHLVPFLQRLPHFQTLSLAHASRITDAGLAYLKDLPNLRGLDLNYTNIGDPGMENIKTLTGLQELRLSHTKVTDAGVESIRGLKDLRTLVLSSTPITDRALDTVKTFPNLETLKLCSTAITDNGLDALKDMKSLRLLTIHNTKFSDQAVRNLQMALPNLVIDTGRQP